MVIHYCASSSPTSSILINIRAWTTLAITSPFSLFTVPSCACLRRRSIISNVYWMHHCRKEIWHVILEKKEGCYAKRTFTFERGTGFSCSMMFSKFIISFFCVKVGIFFFMMLSPLHISVRHINCTMHFAYAFSFFFLSVSSNPLCAQSPEWYTPFPTLDASGSCAVT